MPLLIHLTGLNGQKILPQVGGIGHGEPLQHGISKAQTDHGVNKIVRKRCTSVSPYEKASLVHETRWTDTAAAMDWRVEE